MEAFAELKTFLDNNLVHEVYIEARQLTKASMPSLIELLSAHPLHIRVVPELGNLAFKSTELVHYGHLPVIKMHRGPLSYWYNRLIKRLFDVFFSLLAVLLLLSWMVPLLYVIQWFGSRQGVFFIQERSSLHGKVFRCFKFRSMYNNAHADTHQAVQNDARVTPLGRFLRKFSLDELPQFLNVLAGHMSVVGPRPHMLSHTETYCTIVKRFMVRHTVKPGLTGLAQVNGLRGEIRNLKDIQNRVQFDVKYIENWSFNLDLKIMIITAWLILRGRLMGY